MSMGGTVRWTALALALAAVSAAAPGRAEAQQPIQAGQLRIGVGTGLLELVVEPDRDEDAVGVDLGLTRVSTLVDVGYQLTQAILIGSRVAMAYGKPLGASTDFDRFELLLAPYFHYMFLQGLLRPFVGAEVGGGVLSKTRFDDREGIFLVGLLAGFHYFLSYSAAISPWLELAYERRTNVERNLLRAALYLTVSIWFGGPSGFRGQARAPTMPAVRF